MNTNLHLNLSNSVIIADFDGTLINAKVMTGEKAGTAVPSIISILRDHKVLNAEYSREAQALADFYKSIEKDVSVPFEEKWQAMNDWWTKHFDVLISHNLKREHIRKAANNQNITLRSGTRELINYAKENNIPFIIFSASGIGYDSIKFVLEKEELDFENVVIISNQFVFDENGLAISRNEPVVHSLAKTGTFLMTTKAKDAIADRKEVLVIGDSLHDITMSEGAGFEKVVSVGIANDVSEDNVKKYESTFDMVLKDGESLKKAMQVFS